MSHATAYHIGNNQNTRRKTTEATQPTTARIRQMDAEDKRCAGNQKGQTEIRTHSHAPNAFLKTKFLPKIKAQESEDTIKYSPKMEREFYTSLSSLSVHYGIEILETRQFAYPYNIALSLWDAERRLKQSTPCFDEIQWIKENKKSFLITNERCKIGSSLYYIPLYPIFLILKDKKRKQTAQLLLSVCSYLYHIVNIPYYRQEDSYLFWQYVMMKDWIEQDDEDEDTKRDKAELSLSDWVGDKIEQKIYNLKTLSKFGERLNRFIATDDFDTDCQKIAKQFFHLYQQYPEENIFRNTKITNYESDDYYEHESISMEKYISFWADNEGWLAEHIEQSVNNEFGEYGDIDEPEITKRFDDKKKVDHEHGTLSFETALFKLLDELIYLLNTYKKQRNGTQ